MFSLFSRKKAFRKVAVTDGEKAEIPDDDEANEDEDGDGEGEGGEGEGGEGADGEADGEEKKDRTSQDDGEWGTKNKKDDDDGIVLDDDDEDAWGNKSSKKREGEGESRPTFDDDDDDAEINFGTFGKKDLSDFQQDHKEKVANEYADKLTAAQEAENALLQRDNDRAMEQLGDDFEDTPWVPPSVTRAEDYRAREMFRGGNASILATKVCDAADLSLACVLYFQFAKSMAVMTFVMFFLSLPALIFAYSGSKIAQVDQDSIGLYQFTLGNIGYNPASPTYAKDSKCASMPASYNGTCLHLGGFQEVTLGTAGTILTAMEFLQIVVFFCTVWHLQRKTNSLKRTFEKVESTVSSYSVFVDHLPADTTPEQLISHFTNLYPLDTNDWRHRPPVVGAERVVGFENTGLPFHANTWVAECTLHKKVGKMIRRYKQKDFLFEQLRRQRALIKMYSEDTPHPRYHGGHLRKKVNAVEAMIKVAEKLDRLGAKMKKRHFKLAELDEEAGRNERLPFMLHIEAPCVCAFVVFQYTESMARCVEDYRTYSSFPRVLLYPSRLKFRGHRIHVTQAQEPDSIVWENLEVPWLTKRLYRARTWLLCLLLVVAAFAIDLQATKYKTAMSKSTPKVSSCSADVPRLYAQQNASISTAQLANVYLVREPEPTREKRDALCAALVPGSFYTTYELSGKTTGRVGSYSLSACTAEGAAAAGLPYYGLCPQAGQSVFCPCTSLTSKEECASMECAASPDSALCVRFPASTMGSCMCVRGLQSLLTSKTSSGTDALSQVTALGSDICGSFFINYSTSLALIYVSAFTSVVIAYLLTYATSALTMHEFHNSLDALEGSKMSKLFFSTYLTLAIIILVAYGKIDGLPDLVTDTLGIFNGPYRDFTSAWYGTVGNFLVVTFAFKMVLSYLHDMYELYFDKSLRRCFNVASIEAQRNNTYILQDEVNALYVGPPFNVATRTATLLMLVFYLMTFAPGLPILTPVACITFTLAFRIQKRILLRHAARPAHMDSQIMRNVLGLLPYAAIIRLGFACWMYGNPEAFEASSLSVESAGGGSASVAGVDSSSLTNTGALAKLLSDNASGQSTNYLYEAIVLRCSSPNVVPLLVLLVLIVVVKVVRKLWKALPYYWVAKTLAWLCKREARDKVTVVDNEGVEVVMDAVQGFDIMKRGDTLRLESAPFTGDYYKYLKDKHAPRTCLSYCQADPEDVLDDDDIRNGWEVADQGDRYVVKIKTWTRAGINLGQVRKKGDPKKTFEMIADNSVSSYNIDTLPAYKRIMESIRETCLASDVHNPSTSIVEDYKQRCIDNKKASVAARLGAEVWETDDPDGYFAGVSKRDGYGEYDDDYYEDGGAGAAYKDEEDDD